MKLKFILTLLLAACGIVELKAQIADVAFSRCGLAGSMTVYDLQKNRWHYSDSADAYRQTLPASTFKIINSLIALETGVLKNEHEVFKWDGVARQVPAWNADTDMENAFKNSTVWYYVKLAEKIGRDRYRDFLKRSNYGNGDLDESGTDFWNYGSFGISPAEQIEFLVKFYKNDLPFSSENLDIVKRIMINTDTPDYTLRAKTGWTSFGKIDNGWFIGYVEKKNNTYFFATRISKPVAVNNPNFADCRKQITFNILRQMKIID